jgi:hypothetical protein
MSGRHLLVNDKPYPPGGKVLTLNDRPSQGQCEPLGTGSKGRIGCDDPMNESRPGFGRKGIDPSLRSGSPRSLRSLGGSSCRWMDGLFGSPSSCNSRKKKRRLRLFGGQARFWDGRPGKKTMEKLPRGREDYKGRGTGLGRGHTLTRVCVRPSI